MAPVPLNYITSLWSPNMFNVDLAIDLAATWMTAGFLSPTILIISGAISNKPYEEVNVVADAPVCEAPWHAEIDPASDCIC